MSVTDPVCLQYRDNFTYLFTEERKMFNQFFMLFNIVVATICLLFTLAVKDQYKHTRLRSRVVIVTTWIAVITQVISGPWRIGFGFEQTSCVLTAYATIMVIPLFASPILANTLILILMSQFSTKLHEIAAQNRNALKDSDGNGDLAKEVKRLHRLKFLRSGVGLILLETLMMLPFIIGFAIVAATTPVYAKNCYGCSRGDGALTILVIVEFITYIALMLFVYQKARVYPDMHGFLWEMRMMSSLGLICVINYLIVVFVDINEKHNWDLAFLITLPCLSIFIALTLGQLYIARKKEGPLKLKARYFLPGVRTDFATSRTGGGGEKETTKDLRAASTSEIPTTNSNRNSQVEEESVFTVKDFKSTLKDPTLTKEFEEFLTKECALELLLFYKDSAEWKSNYFTDNKELRLLRAKKIEKLYIKPNGLLQVNLPHSMVQDIKEHLEKSDLDEHLFDKSIKEVRDLLEKGPLMRFWAAKRKSVEGDEMA